VSGDQGVSSPMVMGLIGGQAWGRAVTVARSARGVGRGRLAPTPRRPPAAARIFVI
jgi:hypothetical protein